MAAHVPPTGSPETFLELFTTMTDPYGGDYAAAYDTFAIAVGGIGYNPNRVLGAVMSSGASVPMIFVGLFPYAGEDTGRTRVFHSPVAFTLPHTWLIDGFRYPRICEDQYR